MQPTIAAVEPGTAAGVSTGVVVQTEGPDTMEGSDEITYRREVRHDDVAIVDDIVVTTGVFSQDEVAIAIELVNDRLEKGSRSEYHFIFAEHGKNILGYTCFGPVPGTDRRFEIYWIAVYSAFQKFGIGKNLLKQTEEAIHEMGGLRIYIETSSRKEYEPTRRFYRRNGYEVAAVLKDFHAVGDSNVIFCKQIIAQA